MLSSIFTLALLSGAAFAVEQEKRQATNAAQFTSAANQLISQYIPSSALPAFESAVISAAAAASVTGDPKSLIYEALLAGSTPEWFAAAVPAGYSTQIAALESNIDALRASPTPGGSVVPVVVPVTTTDSAGSTITTSVTTTGSPPEGTVVPVVVGITTTDSAGNTITTSVTTTGSSPEGTIVPVVVGVTTTDSAGNTITTSVTTIASSATGTGGSATT